MHSPRDTQHASEPFAEAPPASAVDASSLARPRDFAPPPRSQSAWQALVRASSKTLGKSPAASHPAMPSAELDERMALAIRANDTRAFDSHFANASKRAQGQSGVPFEAPLALTEAVDQSDLYALHHLIKLGASPDSPIASINSPWADLHNHRLLHRAVDKRLPEMAQALLRHGACVDLQGSVATLKGDTPLMLAAARGFLDMAELLLAAGADLHATDHAGRSALEKSLSYELSYDPDALFIKVDEPNSSRLGFGRDVAKALLPAGAPVSPLAPPARFQPDEHFELPPLAAAIRLADDSLITALIEGGADCGWLFDRPAPGDPEPAAQTPMAIWLRFIGDSPEMAKAVRQAQTCAQSHQAALSRSLALAPPELASEALAGSGEPEPQVDTPAPSPPRARSILASRRAQLSASEEASGPTRRP